MTGGGVECAAELLGKKLAAQPKPGPDWVSRQFARAMRRRAAKVERGRRKAEAMTAKPRVVGGSVVVR